MNRDEYARLYRLEDRLWWFVGMRRIAAALLAPALNGSTLRILDAGCGTGGALRWLAPFGRVWGVERSPDALAYCRQRRLTRVCQGSLLALPYPDAAFDLVTGFDVLYHRGVPDDVAALRELRRVVRPGGWGLVRVPAMPALWSAHDEAVHARQRYWLGELRAKAEQAQWEVVRGTYANTLLLPVAAAARWAKVIRREAGGHTGESEVQEAPGVVNAALTAILWLEAQWLRWADLPLGLSALVLLRAR